MVVLVMIVYSRLDLLPMVVLVMIVYSLLDLLPMVVLVMIVWSSGPIANGRLGYDRMVFWTYCQWSSWL